MSISSLLDTARRSLYTQQQAIRTIGDNIANVNTPGYSRRTPDIVTTTTSGVGAARVGTGVEVDKIVRVVDRFINAELLNKTSDRAAAEMRQEYLMRAESPFALANEPGRIGYQLTDFYSSLEDLTSNPASIPLRTQVIEKGHELVQSIRQTYNELSTLQREADDRIKIVIQDVNQISKQIASLNFEIQKGEIAGGQEALTLRDQRDKLTRELNEYLEVEVVENSNGSYLIYLSDGFALVNDSVSRDLSFVPDPSFAPVGGYPVGLDGIPLGHVVHDFGGGEHVDLTATIRGGGGEIGGLLSVRGVQAAADTETFDAQGDLVDIATRIEYIARDLLSRFNQEYLGPDEDAGTAGHQPSSRDLDGNPPNVFGLFAFDGIAALPGTGDIDGDGLPGVADINAILATGISNFSSIINFNVSDERNIAAARDLDPAAGAVTTVAGDDANIQGLLSQRDVEQTYNTLGAVSITSNLEQLYNITTTDVGSMSARAQNNYTIYDQREVQLEELQASVSAVSLDEEFAKLINFQRAFEASARMVSVGDELFAQIMNMLR